MNFNFLVFDFFQLLRIIDLEVGQRSSINKALFRLEISKNKTFQMSLAPNWQYFLYATNDQCAVGD